uniref:hypothetical protein n=1 Tax=Candidatus Enterovibrio escicola TaxID=1927127 RepID=UPI0012380730|nr:hypothetical protein [Candidatus Enterovibrio escacola]
MKKYLISSGIKQRNKLSRLSVSEVMTIVIAFHQSGYRDFKTYYIHFFYRYLTNEFPELVTRKCSNSCKLFYFRFGFTSLTVRQC